MYCSKCGSSIRPNDRECYYCGEVIPLPQHNDVDYALKREMDYNNRRSLNFGITSLVLNAIAFFYFGFLGFIGLGLSIYGYSLANQSAKQGYTHSGAVTTNIIGIIISSLTSIVMIIFYMSI